MRTTIELPADLMRAAKIRAAELGVTLKELFTRAITHEVGPPPAADKMEERWRTNLSTVA